MMEWMRINRIRTVVLMLLAGLALMAGKAHAAEGVGKITRIKGAVTVERSGEPKPIKATMGMDLFRNDKIVTQAKAYVRFTLVDGSILTLGEKGEMSLAEFDFNPKEKKRTALFNVVIGKLRVFANEMLKFRDNRFNVKTPTAVAGVRGTLFVVWVKSETETRVACLDRVVEVANVKDPRKFVTLTKNIATQVNAGSAPSQPVLMTTRQFREFQQGFQEDIRPGDEEKKQKPVGDESDGEADNNSVPVRQPVTATVDEPNTPVAPDAVVKTIETPTTTTSTTSTTTTTTTSTSTTTTTTSEPTTTTSTSTTTTTTSEPTTTTSTTTTSTTTTTLPPILPGPPGLPQ